MRVVHVASTRKHFELINLYELEAGLLSSTISDDIDDCERALSLLASLDSPVEGLLDRRDSVIDLGVLSKGNIAFLTENLLKGFRPDCFIISGDVSTLIDLALLLGDLDSNVIAITSDTYKEFVNCLLKMSNSGVEQPVPLGWLEEGFLNGVSCFFWANNLGYIDLNTRLGGVVDEWLAHSGINIKRHDLGADILEPCRNHELKMHYRAHAPFWSPVKGATDIMLGDRKFRQRALDLEVLIDLEECTSNYSG